MAYFSWKLVQGLSLYTAGGNKNAVYRNLLFTFILCGIWHGAGIPFFIWGIYHGALLVIERVTGIHKKENLFLRAVTLHLVLFGWIIFRSDSWFTFSRILQNLSGLSYHTNNLETWIVCFLVLYYLYELFHAKLIGYLRLVWYKSPVVIQGFFACLSILFAYYLHRAEVKPFIYFQF